MNLALLAHKNTGTPILLFAHPGTSGNSRYARQTIRLVPRLLDAERATLKLAPGEHVPPVAVHVHNNN